MVSMIFVYSVLIASQSTFAMWDILAREIFAITEHPFNPLAFMAARHLLAGCANTGVALYVHGRSMRNTEPRSGHLHPHRLCLCLLASFLGTVCGQTLYLYGVKMTSATHAAVLQPLCPVVTTFFGVMGGFETLGQGPQRRAKILGILLAVGGAILIVIGSEHHSHHRHHPDALLNATAAMRAANPAAAHHAAAVAKARVMQYPVLGTVLLMGGVVAYAFYMLMQPFIVRVYRPFWASTIFLCAAFPMDCLIFATFIELEGFPKNVQPTQAVVLGMAFCVAVTVFYAVALAWCSQYFQASTVALFMCVHPLATAILDSIVLHNAITLFDLMGASLIMVGFSYNARAMGKAEAGGQGPPGSDSRGEYAKVPLGEEEDVNDGEYGLPHHSGDGSNGGGGGAGGGAGGGLLRDGFASTGGLPDRGQGGGGGGGGDGGGGHFMQTGDI